MEQQEHLARIFLYPGFFCGFFSPMPGRLRGGLDSGELAGHNFAAGF